MTTPRRDLLRNLAGLGLCGSLGDWSHFARLSAAAAAETPRAGDLVVLERDVEPLVRKIEETPRDKCFEMITAELAGGLTYRRFLAALLREPFGAPQLRSGGADDDGDGEDRG